MRTLLFICFLVSATIGTFAQTTEPHIALKAAIEKSSNVLYTSNAYAVSYSDFKVEAAPCTMKFYFQEEFREEDDSGATDKMLAEIKWADVTSVSNDPDRKPLFVTVVAQLNKFKTSKLTNGKYVVASPRDSLRLPLFIKGADGRYDPNSFPPLAALVNSLVQKCGGKVK